VSRELERPPGGLLAKLRRRRAAELGLVAQEQVEVEHVAGL
jgi:hypothetical protein